MEPFADLIARHRTSGILLDSNLLLLLLIGAIDRGLISRFKRTNQFVPEDFDLLSRIVTRFQRLVTTPHVLTEVSNLANSLDERRKPIFFSRLGASVEVIEERYTPAVALKADPLFMRLEITDTAIAGACAAQLLLFTVDASLAAAVASRQGDVINFNHLRVLNW